MKGACFMKRFLCLLMALSLLLCGCVSDPLQEESKATTESSKPVRTTAPTEAAETQPTEPASIVANVVFDHWYSNDQEQGSLTAYDKDGNTLWSYQSSAYPVGQLDTVSDIGGYQGIYYIAENGSILAFDRESGQLLWKNDAFFGSPAGTDCAVFDDDGTLYICGFMGPDLFAVTSSGETLYQDDYLHPDYYWACGMTMTGNWLTIQLDGGPYGDMDTPYLAYVHKNLPPAPVTATEAAALVCDLYKTITEADGTYAVFDSECFEDGGCYTMIVRYQLSDAEADQIIANGGTPSANTYVAAVKVDTETGYIFPEAY